MVRIAAAGHRALCLGQGAELAWMRAPRAADRRPGARHLPAQDRAGVSRSRCGSARRWRAPTAEAQRGAHATTATRSASPIRFATISRTSPIACRRRRRLRRADRCCWRWPATRHGRAGRDRVMALWRGGRPAPTDRARVRALLDELDVESRAPRAARGLQGTGDPHAARRCRTRASRACCAA